MFRSPSEFLQVVALLACGHGIMLAASISGRGAGEPVTVPQCIGVVLRAAYLAEEVPGQGAGFQLSIENDRPAAIAVPQPVPLSVHWYAAAAGGRWLWRASSGDGGSLVNALQEHGRLFASTGAPGALTRIRVIPPRQTYTWSEFSGDIPALRYRPGCRQCTYQGERQFRAVLAYAYLPPQQSGMSSLLRCGLRSRPVVMPPLASGTGAPHNSVKGPVF